MLQNNHHPYIIVGGGVAGLAACLHLCLMGHKPLLLEQHLCGSGASSVPMGMLSPVQGLAPADAAWLQLTQAALPLFAQWDRLLGTATTRPDSLELALRPDDVPGLRAHYEWLLRMGAPARWLDRSLLAQTEPLLAPNLAAAIATHQEPMVSTKSLIQKLHMQCVQLGAQVVEHNPVHAWQVLDGGSVEVQTLRGSYTCTRMLLATGAMEPMPLQYEEKIYPEKGQLVVLGTNPSLPLRRIIRVRSKAYGQGYLVPTDQGIVCGSTHEALTRDLRPTASGLQGILQQCLLAVPALADAPIQHTWCGLRPITMQRLPVLKKIENGQVVVLNGLGNHGLLLAPLMGQAAAELLVRDTLHPLLQHLSQPNQH